MTTREFHQIASCASMIAELAKNGEEISNAINSERESIDFYKAHGLPTDFPEAESIKYTIAKAKIEERLKAKNEELQKFFAKDLCLISDSESMDIAILEGWKSTWELDNIENGGDGNIDDDLLIERGREIINEEINCKNVNYNRVNSYLTSKGYTTLRLM